MEIFLALLVIGAFAFIFVASYSIITTRREIESINNNIENIYDRIGDISRAIRDINGKLDSPQPVEPQPATAPEPEETEEEAVEEEVEEAAEEQPAIPLPPPVPEFLPPYVAEESPAEPQPQPFAAMDDEPVSEPEPESNFEKTIGENLFSKIGILILVVGIGFFVKYAIDRDWISEITRTVLGIVAGVGLWALAWPLRERYRNFSSILAGGGFAVCFVTIAIACNLYSIFSPAVALASLVALTAAMIACALLLNRRELALIAIVGGFVAPFIASNPDGSRVMLLLYVAVLDAAMFVVTLRRRWWVLPVVSCFPTWLVAFITILGKDHVSAMVSAVVFSVYFIMFSIPLVSVMRREGNSRSLSLWLTITVIFNAIAYLVLVTSNIPDNSLLSHVKGIFTLTVSVVNAAIFIRYYRNGATDGVRNLILGLTIFATLLFWPVQFASKTVIISGLAVTMTMLTVMYVSYRRNIYHYTALLTGIIVVMTLLSPISAGLYSVMTYGSIFWTYFISGISFLSMAWVINHNLQAYDAKIFPKVNTFYTLSLWIGAIMTVNAFRAVFEHAVGGESALMLLMTTILAALLIISAVTSRGGNLLWLMPVAAAGCFALLPAEGSGDTVIGEIALWTGAVLAAAVIAVSATKCFRSGYTGPLSRGTMLTVTSLSATLLVVAATTYGLRSSGATEYYSAGFSVSMTVCGAVMMIMGLRRHIKLLRMTGLALFAIVLVKLVCHDLWVMAPVGRIIVFILLGVILLAISFLYHKLHSVLFDDSE